MTINELAKNIHDTVTYNNVTTDTDESITFLCDLIPMLTDKNATLIYQYVVAGLLQNYAETSDNGERVEIENTIQNIMEYLAK